MPRYYSPDQKAAALHILDSTFGNIALTSDRTGIPQRTLRDWRTERNRSSPPSPPSSPPVFDDELDALAYMRQQILAELLNVSANLKDTFAHTAPHHRLRVLSDLLDRLMKLDQTLKPYQPSDVFRISWETGLYVRTPTERHGPFSPADLPSRWRELFSPKCSLELYWRFDNIVTPVPEGPFMNQIFQTIPLDDYNERPRIEPFEDDYWESPDWRNDPLAYTIEKGYKE